MTETLAITAFLLIQAIIAILLPSLLREHKLRAARERIGWLEWECNIYDKQLEKLLKN